MIFDMKFDIPAEFQKAFGIALDQETAKVFDGARANGMSDHAILSAIYCTQNTFEKGYASGQAPGKEVVHRLRDMYRGGIR